MIRPNERRTNQLRTTKIKQGFSKHAAGSVIIESGDTVVLCSAMVEEKVPPFLKGTNNGWVTAEYSLLPSSTDTRSQREVNRGKVSGRTSEIQRLIGRSLRAVVDMEALGERTVWIDCDVLQADGGTRTASVTGAFVAMYLAFKDLKEKDILQEIPITDYVAATSVGIVEGVPVLDLEYVEDSEAQVDMNVVMTSKGEFIEVQGTAEGKPYSKDELQQLLNLAESGIIELIKMQKSFLGE
ncbi:Ribonuclease PH [Candidatus Syntrophocurvum alkaliphilum]|uniref:Ribonuclease PH n=1 Tax=Candidatus Syntrophocurvum alkaliphilum TaxID=2293317 RepID=A0A6I6D8N0_9FIRM|nr:ribonuclease PH [Candidatus Syntrophocurvum alkaliphilum]QGT98877.1 Ribonuclease PH [Candidatus Syntrophocurvum alkaliphilum]